MAWTRTGRRPVTLLLALALAACSPSSEGPAAVKAPTPGTAPAAPLRVDDLVVIGPGAGPYPVGVPLGFRLESQPTLPESHPVEWRFSEGERIHRVAGHGPTIETAVPEAGRISVTAHVGAAASKPLEIALYRVSIVDGEGKALHEARTAPLPASAFDEKGRLRPESLAKAAERMAIDLDDPLPGAGASVVVKLGPGRTLSLPLAGSGASRLSKSFVLLADRLDAEAAGPDALWARPGDRIDLEYRGRSAGSLTVGPSVIHAIPVRLTVAGPGLPPLAELRKALDLRLAQANDLWEPFGRRFVAAEIARLESLAGLILIRGRASGVDRQGKPARVGVLLDGRAVAVGTVWKDDGAPWTPGATARALISEAGDAYRVERFDGLLAGDPSAIVLRATRRDGSPASLARLVGGEDGTQIVAPFGEAPAPGCEVAPAADRLTLDELALLVSAKSPAFDGLELIAVAELRAFQSRPAYKVYPPGRFPTRIAGAAIVSWSILDASGKYPYGVARTLGELLLPAGLRPEPEDTLFSDPMSELPGTAGRKRLTAATASKISERGRGLSGLK